MEAAEFWNRVYQSKRTDSVSWFASHLDQSLELIQRLVPARTAAIVDIGGGASTLIDDLLRLGYRDLSVIDISATAIALLRDRLGSMGELVSWHVGDITRYDLGIRRFDLWHDRAVFHFLTDAAARAAYVERVRRTVKPGGFIVMATFGPEGPVKCSGLDVVRYDAQRLLSELGEGFTLVGSGLVNHATPMNTNQQFLYCWCRVDA